MKEILIRSSLLNAIEVKVTYEYEYIKLSLNEYETGQRILWHLNPKLTTYKALSEIVDKITEIIYINDTSSLCEIGTVIEDVINTNYAGYVLERDFPDFDNYQNPKIKEFLADENHD